MKEYISRLARYSLWANIKSIAAILVLDHSSLSCVEDVEQVPQTDFVVWLRLQ
jgi:hypothetical protein